MEKNWESQSQKKVVAPKNLERFVKNLREKKKTIATLNGSFDLLHAGHLHMIYEAYLQADILIVGLNSDSSIQKYKEKTRPIIPLKYRLEMLSAFYFVDYVTWFDETDPRELILKIRPDVHVNGVEYGQKCIEADVVQSINARLHLVKRIKNLSTTEIIGKILTCV